MHRIEVIDSHTGGEPTRVDRRRRSRSRSGPARRSGASASGASSTASAPRSSTSRAARTCSSARCSSRRRTHRAPPASSSSTTSATSACAATAPSASSPRSRISGRIGAGAHRIETPVGVVTAHAASGRRGLGRQRAELAESEGGHRRRAGHRRGHRRRRVGRQLVLPGRRPRAGARARQRRSAHRLLLARAPGGERARAIPDVDHVELFGPPRDADGATRATSCCARARPTTARRAAPARAPSSPASPPTASWRKATRGCRRASSAARSPAVPLARSRGGEDRAGDHRQGVRQRRSDAAARRARSVRARHRLGRASSWTDARWASVSSSSAAASSACAPRTTARGAACASRSSSATAQRRDGCSFGNAGMIVPSHFVPLAAPGMVGARAQVDVEPGVAVLREAAAVARSRRLGLQILARGNAGARASRGAAPARPEPREPRCYEELAALPGSDFGLVRKGLLMLCRTRHALDEETRPRKWAARSESIRKSLDAERGRRARARHPDGRRRRRVLSAGLPPHARSLRRRRCRTGSSATGVEFVWNTEVAGWRIEREKHVRAASTTRRPRDRRGRIRALRRLVVAAASCASSASSCRSRPARATA